MSHHHAELVWQRAPDEQFEAGRYSRRHLLRFDGGAEVVGSASPSIVPLPWSDASAVDPEEAFVGALASCHMLFFLSFASAEGWRVDGYRDAAIGTMARNGEGRLAMTEVVLRPQVEFGGELRPLVAEVDALHHRAHEACFIANSVRTEVRVEPLEATPAAVARIP